VPDWTDGASVQSRASVITQDGKLIRELTLDPSRDYQPLGRQ
jgi:hypothetical protein